MFWKGKKETPAPAAAYCPWCMAPLGEDGLCPACGRAAKDYEPEPFHLRPGTVLNGRYVLGAVLDRGLTGITYLCRDVRLERKAAVKEYYYIASRDAAVSPAVVCGTPNEEARREFEDGKAWFRRQAMALARMEALPSVVGVSDYFEANGTEYMVMEFVEGTTLKAYVKDRGRMPFGELMEAAGPLARDVAAMNGRYGVICRDITPDNIIRMPDGRLRLMGLMPADWPSHVFLTRGFAPIEQYSRAGQGPWTDVYSLCAVICYCITGKVPADAPDRAVTLHDGPDPLRPPSELGAAIGPEQERALMKGLALMPKDRWQDADALLAALYGG